MFCGASIAEPFAIHLDPSKDFIRDLRDTSAAPVLGYAGSMLEFNDSLAHVLWHDCSDDLATALRDGGARLVKEWNSLDKWQIGMAYAQAKSVEERESLRKRFGRSEGLVDDPKVWFSFRKKHGMKVFICLEQYRVWTDVAQGVRTNEIGIVKKVICDYLRWIRDNGFAGQVAGFELGNEPYWGKDPEEYGRRWCEIVPEMKKIWPDAKIGIPLAEYRPNDPDIAAVRARCEDMTWCESKGEFSFSRLNQWSGRFIAAMKPVLNDITHVIYHFYGANAAYGCSMSGFNRIANFAKVYPEIKDKKAWITEWRERSDEDNRCHQMFFSALWKAHYMLTVLTRPEVDGISNHCIGSLSGGFYVSDGKEWQVQWDEKCKNYPDVNGDGRPRIELGPSGPLFRLYTDALVDHPVILNSGANGRQGIKEKLLARGIRDYSGSWASALYYDGREKGVQWVAATNPDRTSLALLCANSRDEGQTFNVELAGFSPSGKAHVRAVSCPADKVRLHAKPGEPKPWRMEEKTESASVHGRAFTLNIPSNSYMTFIIPIAQP